MPLDIGNNIIPATSNLVGFVRRTLDLLTLRTHQLRSFGGVGAEDWGLFENGRRTAEKRVLAERA